MEILNYIRAEKLRLQGNEEAVLSIQDKLEKLSVQPSLFHAYLDFDSLNHEQVIEVISAFGGRWTKSLYGSDRIHYTRDEPIGNLTLRCYAGAPPPNCRLVTETTEVPEQVIPAHLETTTKLVCSDDQP